MQSYKGLLFIGYEDTRRELEALCGLSLPPQIAAQGVKRFIFSTPKSETFLCNHSRGLALHPTAAGQYKIVLFLPPSKVKLFYADYLYHTGYEHGIIYPSTL